MQNENCETVIPLTLLTADQMRALERREMDTGRQTGLELMERAGCGVVSAIFSRWSELATSASRALVLCGPGNNGGDGFVIARHLVDRGWQVEVFLYGAPEALPPDARENYQRYASAHCVAQWDNAAIASAAHPDLVVDAVFGIGLTRALPEEVLRGLAAASGGARTDAIPVRRVAVDCPSGLNLDTGQGLFFPENIHDAPPLDNLRADLTVTFHCPKPGHILNMGPSICGALAVVDIGLQAADSVTSGACDTAYLVAPEQTEGSQSPWPLSVIRKTRSAGHKYDYGHAFVFSGGSGRGGAARLAARAALRSGAGLVTVICPPDALAEHAAALDAVMLRTLSHDAALDTVADTRVTAFCLGPGMGLTPVTRRRVLEVLRACDDTERDVPSVVLDADALTVFRDDPHALFDAVHHRTILTPHEGEFARLFPDLALAVIPETSKIERARAAAVRAGCVILLKGPDTVIAAPDGRVRVHAACYDRTAPWLATAGAGDVLAGLIAGLTASDPHCDPFDMAAAAAWLHVECALTFGPGLIAEDLPEQLPTVFQKLVDQATMQAGHGVASAVPSSIPSA